MTQIIIAAAVVGGIGILLAILLCIASEKFKVAVDEKEVAVRALLPGNNCGGCGYPGCDGLAAAIAKGEAPVNACPVAAGSVSEEISAIVGVETVASVRMTAVVKCAGTCEEAKDLYEYVGPQDCRMAANHPNGGPKGCTSGCLGFGNCQKVCPYSAITLIKGIAYVDKEKCKACRQCVAACPRHLIEIVPYSLEQIVRCNSHEKGKDVKMVCNAGCIGCTLCARNCPVEAISMENNLAHIVPDKCMNCGTCREKCPVKIIQ